MAPTTPHTTGTWAKIEDPPQPKGLTPFPPITNLSVPATVHLDGKEMVRINPEYFELPKEQKRSVLNTVLGFVSGELNRLEQ